jgi:predicted DNA-binding transcriptional regulator AlpA
MDTTTLMSVKILLARIGISKATLKRLLAAGKGPERIRLGKRVLVSEAALQCWLASNTEQPAPAAQA